MKVLILISGGDTGGAKTHLYALLEKLNKKIPVRLVCFMDGDFLRGIREMGVDARLLVQKSRFDMSVLDSLVGMIENEGFDIVHAHGARANFIAAALKKKVDVPFITTIHSDYLRDFDGIYRKILYTGLNILALAKMDYYIAVSGSFKRMLIERGFRPNDIFTVYNGIDYEKPFACQSREDFFWRCGIVPNENEIFVGIIGRHDNVKGHDIFMRGCCLVAKKYKNVRFLVAGSREGEDSLRQIAEEEGFSDRFVFCGFISDIYSFVNVCDINTITSRSESFPYVMLEGARLRKPLISSNVGGISDLVVDMETGLLFDNENYSDFADKIAYLIDNPEERARLGEALYERATSVFSSENLADEHVKIYNSVLRYKNSGKKYDAVISGYYGFDNCGDDALLFSILKSLRQRMPDIRFLLLTAKPGQGKRLCMTDASYRFNPFSIVNTMKSTSILINGGGSLIQDSTSSKSLWYYLLVILSAKKHGAKVFALANGIGPISKKNLKITKKAVKRIDKITLRDKMSAEELLRIYPEAEYELTADPAITLEGSKKEKVLSLLSAEGVPENTKTIGVSVREWNRLDSRFTKKMKSALENAYEKYGLVPVFIPMKYPDDIRISLKISETLSCPSYVLKKRYGVDDIIGIISSMDIILAMRLHTLIFASGHAVPCIGIIYDPKVRGFMEYIGQDRFVSAEAICEDEITKHIDSIMTNFSEIKNELKKNTERLVALAERNTDIAIEMLKGMKS